MTLPIHISKHQVLRNFFLNTNLHGLDIDIGLRAWMQGYYMPLDYSLQDFLLEQFCERWVRWRERG